MIKRHIVGAAPPPPVGVSYAHASEADGWLYVTGQLPTDPRAPAAPFAEGIEAQTERTLQNLRIIVEAAGYSFADTVFARIYLSDFDRDYDGLNRAFYRVFAGEAAAVSRTTVGVARLGRGALVEIDLVLRKPGR
jgi:enamine deaminase RidA (YjgF/YER057c/UK114 family)